ncbi:hypothetical protein K457DRAFT_13079 [Linnemannia elongata AG-77]|uniref:Uncharacterized protein n=1 Tax=Linnemannia elongata AG-77 TaxID=1314771 RepID=A0A197KFA7_9FUNG|nr:hypothetical protein K457DRAFT_13079 [Linnemannia elongata AG-77]
MFQANHHSQTITTGICRIGGSPRLMMKQKNTRSVTLFTVTLAVLLLAFVSTATAECYPNSGTGYKACLKEGFPSSYCDSMFLNSTCYRVCLGKAGNPGSSGCHNKYIC